MDGKLACLGSLLLACGGVLLVALGTPGGRYLFTAGVLALVLTAVHSMREGRKKRAV